MEVWGHSKNWVNQNWKVSCAWLTERSRGLIPESWEKHAGRNELYDVDGRASVTKDEEQVLRVPRVIEKGHERVLARKNKTPMGTALVE